MLTGMCLQTTGHHKCPADGLCSCGCHGTKVEAIPVLRHGWLRGCGPATDFDQGGPGQRRGPVEKLA